MTDVESRLAYTVHASFEGGDPHVVDRWIDWLREEHLLDVCRAGALAATVVRLDVDEGQPPRCEARYVFASRSAFATYERDHAPRLRAEGLARFPPALGIRYRRSVGRIMATRDAH